MMYKFLIFVLLLSGCSKNNSNEAPKQENTSLDTPKLKETIGANALEIIRAPEKVSILSLEPSSTPLQLNYKQINEFQSLLLNDAHYHFGFIKKIMFLPSYNVTFIKGSSELRMEISLPSSQIRFQMGDESITLDDDPAAKKIESFIQSL